VIQQNICDWWKHNPSFALEIDRIGANTILHLHEEPAMIGGDTIIVYSQELKKSAQLALWAARRHPPVLPY
jgi:hypothetical protein